MADTKSESAVKARARINGETAKITWQELQRFFAQGHALAVSHKLDLVEVAYQIPVDNKVQLEAWMEAGHVDVVSDTQALGWLEANALMWSVVVRPGSWCNLFCRISKFAVCVRFIRLAEIM